MLTASSEPCISIDGQVASISRDNHAFCAGRAAKSPGCSVKPPLHPMPRQNLVAKSPCSLQSHLQSGFFWGPSGKCRLNPHRNPTHRAPRRTPVDIDRRAVRFSLARERAVMSNLKKQTCRSTIFLGSICATIAMSVPTYGAERGPKSNQVNERMASNIGRPNKDRKANDAAFKLAEFKAALKASDAQRAKRILVENGASDTIQVVIHGDTAGTSGTTLPLDNLNGSCLAWGWYWSYSSFPPPYGANHYTYGCVKWGGSNYEEQNGIWYPE